MTDAGIAGNLLTFLPLAGHPEQEAGVISQIEEVARGHVRSEHIAYLTYTRQVFGGQEALFTCPIITRTATRAFPLGGFIMIPAVVLRTVRMRLKTDTMPAPTMKVTLRLRTGAEMLVERRA